MSEFVYGRGVVVLPYTLRESGGMVALLKEVGMGEENRDKTEKLKGDTGPFKCVYGREAVGGLVEGKMTTLATAIKEWREEAGVEIDGLEERLVATSPELEFLHIRSGAIHDLQVLTYLLSVSEEEASALARQGFGPIVVDLEELSGLSGQIRKRDWEIMTRMASGIIGIAVGVQNEFVTNA